MAELAVKVDPAGAAKEARAAVARHEAKTLHTGERPSDFGVKAAREAFQAMARE